MKWITYLQQVQLVIKKKKGKENKVTDCRSCSPTTTLNNVMKTCGYNFIEWIALNDPSYLDFTYPHNSLTQGLHAIIFHLFDKLLFRLGHLYVSSKAPCSYLTWETHYFKIVGQFEAAKTLVILATLLLATHITIFSNKSSFASPTTLSRVPTKLGLYTPLLPQETINTNILSRLLATTHQR